MKRILLFLLLSMILSSARASDTLTVRQVFNFNVGDTFDYKQTQFNQCTGFFAISYLRKVVIAKSYSLSQDTIYYQYNLSSSGWWPFSGNQFFNSTLFDTITHLDSFAIYTASRFSTANNCHTLDSSNTIYFGHNSDSITIACFESSDVFRYTQRLGMTYYSLNGSGDPCGSNGNKYELIHFANDSMHFGYDVLDGIADLSEAATIYLSPNPAITFLHLIKHHADINSLMFTLTDILSQTVYTSPITQSETSINISYLANGMYTWRLVSGNEIIKTGKVVKE